MYTLYYSPGASSMCVHHALIEADVEHRLVVVDIAAGQQREPAHLALNPQGLVPTLVIEGTAFSEAAPLLMMIATRHPIAMLCPPEQSPMRAHWYQWMLYFANTIQPAFRHWFNPADVTSDAAGQEALKAAMRRQIESGWGRVDTHLALNGPYMIADGHSTADLYLIMLMRWARNMPVPATEWPALGRYATRMKLRPSWRQLCRAEGLVEWA